MENKTKKISFRVTEKEFAQAKKKAGKMDLRLSEYLRFKVFGRMKY